MVTRMTASTSRRRGESGSSIGTRLLGRGVDDGHVGDGAFVGFQTLDKRFRAFFLLRQGKKHITLAAVPHSPRLLPPFFTTIAGTGISRRRRAGRIERSPLLDFLGLHNIP